MDAPTVINRSEADVAHGIGIASGRQDELFEIAPPAGLQRRLGLLRPDQFNVTRRAVLVALIGWIPLVLLALAAGIWSGGGDVGSFFRETGVHARYLVAAPILVLAERECASQLNVLVRQFLESGIVPESQSEEWERSIASTRALLGSNAAEIVVVAIAYLIVAATIGSHPASEIPIWHKSASFHFSPAGWWHVLVSLPLLLVLILGWMWRLVLWTRLLWLISGLDLRLVTSHPDHAAGLGFVGHSVRAFSIVALALAAIAAGRSAHIVLESDGGLPTTQLVFNVGLLAAIAILFTAPLVVFLPTLLEAWRRGAAEYGALASRLGRVFEDKWFRHESKEARDAALDKLDFSPVADLSGILSNVYALRFVPIDLKSMIALVLAMLLPFVPVVLLAVPLDRIWSGIQKLLF
jgi:hypothetical protein